jgi:hypothetical protein
LAGAADDINIFGGQIMEPDVVQRPSSVCKKLARRPVLGYRLRLKFAPARRTPIHNINEAPRYI